MSISAWNYFLRLKTHCKLLYGFVNIPLFFRDLHEFALFTHLEYFATKSYPKTGFMTINNREELGLERFSPMFIFIMSLVSVALLSF